MTIINLISIKIPSRRLPNDLNIREIQLFYAKLSLCDSYNVEQNSGWMQAVYKTRQYLFHGGYKVRRIAS